MVPAEPRASGVASIAPTLSPQASPNLRLALHSLTELAILGAAFWGWRAGEVSALTFGLVAGVIGGWLPASILLQAVQTVVLARAGGAPQAPTVPPPVTVLALAALAPLARFALGRFGLLALVVFSFACGPAVRNGALDLVPGVEPLSGCAEGATRCAGAQPQACAEGRWWSAMPRRPDGSERACEGRCIPPTSSERAHCGPVAP